MVILGIDLGGTKLSLGVFEQSGEMILKQNVALENRVDTEVGELIGEEIRKIYFSQISQIYTGGVNHTK